MYHDNHEGQARRGGRVLRERPGDARYNHPPVTSGRDELSAATMGALVLAFVTGTAVGWAWGGPLGAFVGAAAGATAGIVAASWRRLQRVRRTLGGPGVPDVGALPPQRALAVMAAVSGGEAAPGMATFRSELLARLEEIRDQAGSNGQLALALARELSTEHPRNPAARAEVARLHLALGDTKAGVAAGAEAIALALDGGMNPTAAKLFEELEAHRDALRLTPRHRELLARVLDHRQDISGAAWCRAALEEPRDARPATDET